MRETNKYQNLTTEDTEKAQSTTEPIFCCALPAKKIYVSMWLKNQYLCSPKKCVSFIRHNQRHSVEMENTLQTAGISTLAFWDVNPLEIDMEKDSLMVMNRVFNYGKWSDIVGVLDYYGYDRIKTEIIHANWLKGSALSFLCLILGLEKRQFKTINRRKSIIWNRK